MKKWIYLVADILLAILVIFLIGSLIIPGINKKRAEKLIVGTWTYDIQNGAATAYYTFYEDGTMASYYDIKNLPDGYSLDTSDFGNVTWSIENKTLVLQEGLMGVGRIERFSLRFEGKDTMYIQDSEYTRYVENSDS
jgi:hypothetical protein